MGACGSRRRKSWREVIPDDDELNFDILGLSEEDVKQFLNAFFSLSPDGQTQVISIQRILDELDLSLSYQVACHIFNKSSSIPKGATLSFREFVLRVWYFLTQSQVEMLEFLVDLFAPDQKAAVTSQDIRKGVFLVHGNHRFGVECESAMSQLGGEIEVAGGSIDRCSLIERLGQLPVLFQPVFTMQTLLREVILGTHYWHLREVQSVRLKREAGVLALFAATADGQPSCGSVVSSEDESSTVVRGTNQRTAREIQQAAEMEKVSPQMNSHSGSTTTSPTPSWRAVEDPALQASLAMNGCYTSFSE